MPPHAFRPADHPAINLGLVPRTCHGIARIETQQMLGTGPGMTK